MTAIDKNCYEQLKNSHHELSMIGEPLSNPETFVEDWWQQEDYGSFHLGVPSFPDRPALVFLVRAALALTAGEHLRALELLRIAIEDIGVTQTALEQTAVLN
jgi:hypothetical protein